VSVSAAGADSVTLRQGTRFHRSVVALLAALAYVPALLSSPGRMPADTKLYLYLDPGGIITKAPNTWDPGQLGGWVPHQMIQYLWPAGPWFWVCEHIGLPDWIAHRLWIATILFLGGLGVYLFVKAIGMPPVGAAIAALVYQLSPFVLPYISRTSAMLLPWAALGWLLLLTMKSVRLGGWRHPAILALVVCTVAGVNATAFAVILPAPIIWVYMEWRAQRLTTRQVLTASGRITVLSIAVSVWWVAMLSIQSKYGADVLAYSETLDAVAYTSNSVEVMRGLGYWLFYVRDPYAAATTSSIPYQESLGLITIGFLLLLLCLLGLVITRFAQRRYAIALVTVGLLLSVGVHPFDDPSPVAAAMRSSGLALALRSSTRAIPLVSLGLGLGAAALVTAVRRQHRRHGRSLGILVVLLIAANLPSLWTAGLVDPALERDQDPPQAWLDAADDLDQGDTTSRVLQIPGAEFGAFRWGYTVDQPVAGLTDKALLTRDLLPLGTVQLMDLLYALDNRVHTDALDPDALARVSRFLAADRLWITGDMAFERFRTVRPEIFAALFTDPPEGLGTATPYGEPFVSVPDISMVDEQSISDPRVGTPLAPVLLVPVDDPSPLVRIGSQLVVLDGSGDGIVDASAAGLLYGDELVRYAADLTADEWAALPADTVFVVTDSNRDRDLQWRGSQDTVGMTESGGPSHDGRAADNGAVRLPVFAVDSADDQTIAVLDNGLTVQATTYGEVFSYLPEYRAAMAVDGDPATDWRAGQRWDPIGEQLTISGSDTTTLQLLQLQGPQFTRMITAVDIDVDGTTRRVALDATSLTGDGQTVQVPSGDTITITILTVEPRPGAPRHGEEWVGFAEVGPTAQEWVRPPTRVLATAPTHAPIALAFHRDRARATDRWRRDPEPVLARSFRLTTALEGTLTVQLRLAQRADDATIDTLAGLVDAPTSDRRLTGVASARASAAFDDDPATSWISPFNTAVGSTITVPLLAGSTVSSLRMLQPASAELAPITQLRIGTGDTSTVVDVPAADSDGYSTISFPQATTDEITIEVAAVASREITERRMGVTAEVPAAIAEITGLPTAARAATTTGSTCRDDLLTLDGAPLAIEVDPAALLAGDSVTVRSCAGRPLRLTAGDHHLLSVAGRLTAIDVDAVTIAPDSPASAAAEPPEVRIDSFADTEVQVTVEPCPQDCWLIFGEGHNPGWEATVDGHVLHAPVPVSGGANGWLLPASSQPRQLTITFTPQRTLDLAVAVSAGAVVVCVVLALWPLVRRRMRLFRVGTPALAIAGEHPSDEQPSVTPPTLVAPWALVRRSTALRSGVLLVLTSALFISFAWGLGAAAVAATLVHIRRPRLAGLTSVLGFGAFGVLVLGVAVVRDTPAGTGWPGQLEPIHRAGVFLILLLATTLVAGDEAPGEGDD